MKVNTIKDIIRWKSIGCRFFVKNEGKDYYTSRNKFKSANMKQCVTNDSE